MIYRLALLSPSLRRRPRGNLRGEEKNDPIDIRYPTSSTLNLLYSLPERLDIPGS